MTQFQSTFAFHMKINLIPSTWFEQELSYMWKRKLHLNTIYIS